MEVFSKEVTSPRNENETGIFRNISNLEGLTSLSADQPKTSVELFEQAVSSYPNRDYLGEREYNQSTKKFENYKFLTYSQVHSLVKTLSNGIFHLLESSNLINIESRPKVTIFSKNTINWWLTDLALNYKNFISVGLFDTLGLDQLVYILNHSQSAVTFCQFDKIPVLLKLSAKLNHLKVIVCMDYKPNQSEVFEVLKKWNNSIGKFKLLKFDEVMKFGEEFSYPDNLPKPDDIATICYTSGTTGTPKGAMLRHYSLQLVAYSSNQMLKPFEGEENTLISYMPLSHCYERNCQYRTLLMKGRVGFYSGDVTRLFEDIRTLKPTSFATVPRVLNRIYDIIKSKFELQNGLNGSMFKVALYHKQKIYNSTGDFTHPIWDKLIFSKVRELLGGKLRFISCGSAPLQGHILHFLRLVFGLSVVEGYGATETTTTISITPVGDHRANHVGAPLAHCEVKLASIPEMEYLVSDKPYPRGEILVRGDTLFRGYYKEPEKTHDAFDSEGFYKTGDVGYINEEGLITIIDRKSSFFKLSQGEFVTPERVEHIIRQHPVVQTAFITGLRTESTTVCIIVPDMELFKTWYSKEFPALNLDSISSLSSNLLIKEKLLEEMKNLCKKNKIAKFEVPSNLYIEIEPFSIEKGLLTPTSKICRPKLNSYYKDIIGTLYHKIEQNQQ